MEKNTVTSQPRPEVMDVYNLPLADEEANAPCHRHCHIARLRQLLIPVVLAFLALVGVLLLSPFDITGGHSLFSRAVNDAGSSTGSGSFVDNKLYLIVVFVGLVVVVILGICLSFWCCKGAFENPCCCPCYLCACCGGLACLECIGCGLCAAGAEAM